MPTLKLCEAQSGSKVYNQFQCCHAESFMFFTTCSFSLHHLYFLQSWFILSVTDGGFNFDTNMFTHLQQAQSQVYLFFLTQPPLFFNQEARLLRTNSPMQSTMVWAYPGCPQLTQSTARAPATAYKDTTFPHVTPEERQTRLNTAQYQR